MTAGRRLLNFAFLLLAAGAVWVLAQWLWPYLELVAPVGALVVVLFAVNVIDGIWFAIRNRRRDFAVAASTTPAPGHYGRWQGRRVASASGGAQRYAVTSGDARVSSSVIRDCARYSPAVVRLLRVSVGYLRCARARTDRFS